MVLQRDVSASVWGFADVEGEVIELVLEGKVYQTTAYRGKLLGLVFIMPVVSCKIIIAYTVLSEFIVFFSSKFSKWYAALFITGHASLYYCLICSDETDTG